MAAGNVLVIEDEQRLRLNLKVLLSHEGYTVTLAADGNEGVRCLQNASFDIVITDIMMEGGNGFQVLEYIATHVPNTLAIVITGYASTESAIEALRKGAYDYIAKPFEIEMIKISLERAMEKVRLQRALKRHTEELEQRVAERTQALEAMNQELHRSMAALQATQEQLIQTEKLSALGELISGFAHELNNPLTSVLGYAELLTKLDSSAPDMHTMLEKISQEAVRCHRIVKNLLGFARKQQPAKTYLDINALCRKTLELLAYQFRVNNVTTMQRLAPQLPWTMADEHQLQQVLVNILTNAYQAMAGHRGRGLLTLTTATEAAQIFIKIADTGPGIAAKELPRIFDPFYTTKVQGTGLGLSLSYGIIKEHGGEITVSSTPGKGTTFTIALNVITAAAPGLATYATPPHATTPGKKVLVVDDEPNSLQLFVALLQFLGHQVEAVSSGREALRKIAAQDYELVICDVKMPEVDGRRVYRFMKGHRPASISRLIFSSGDTLSEDLRKFLENTGCLFLPKPFLLDEFKQVIAQASLHNVGAY